MRFGRYEVDEDGHPVIPVTGANYVDTGVAETWTMPEMEIEGRMPKKTPWLLLAVAAGAAWYWWQS